MQDKEVVQFTRNGLMKKDLNTGKTETLYQSDFAKEKRYQPVREDSQYHSPYECPPDPSHEDAPKATRTRKERQPEARKAGTSPSSQSALAKEEVFHRPGTAKTGTRAGTGPGKDTYTYGQASKGVKYYYTAKDTGDHIYTHSELRKRFRSPGDIRKNLLRDAGSRFLHDTSEEDDDNPAVQSVRFTSLSASHVRSGIHKAQEHREIRHFTFRTAERAPVSGTAYSFGHHWEKVAVSKAKRAKSAGSHIRRTEKAVKGVAGGLMKHPAVLKWILLAAAILFGMILFLMLIDALLGGLTGTTVDHPGLSEYVEQLDSDFFTKIDALKADYEKGDNTTATIVGDESVATDPNALAILATGEWIAVDLTPENKEKLAKCHAILNTYTVSAQDETVTETSSNSDGTTFEAHKVIHHFTIQVHVYTAMEKLDAFGFMEKQKDDVSGQLKALNEMTAEMYGNSGGSGETGIVSESGNFIWPLPGHTYVSSGYGSRTDPITGQAGAFHTGLDIPAPTGTPVLASADGTVIYSGVKGGYGNCVIIQHANSIQTLYGHNSELLVQVGDTVTQGQVIAKVGQTGRATGPHCHFEFRVNGRHVDPAPYIEENN